MTNPLYLLRAPPFPGVDASVSEARVGGATALSESADALFARLREARVGGRFWAAPANLALPPGIVLRPRQVEDLAAQLATMDTEQRQRALWIAPSAQRSWTRALAPMVAAGGGEWRGDVDPWSALADAECLVAHGDDEWVALARIAGVPVRVLSPGRFGAPGDDAAALAMRAVRALVEVHYRDPFTDAATTLVATINLLAGWRSILAANRPIVAACGMAWWKRAEIRRFLWAPARPLRLVRRPTLALALARRAGGGVAIWPSRVSPALVEAAARDGVPLIRVEDGFVRSVGLGSALVPPCSVVVDVAGIHFDPSKSSDLERILTTTDFSSHLLERARALRGMIVAGGISKYAAGSSPAAPVPPRQAGRKLVLVPAQVEDDMSVVAGGGDLRSNLELLRRARAREPEAEIWFRPHPDVGAGYRKGAVPDIQALVYADRIVREPSMAALLDVIDAVHVLTSLTGFEALLRGREVICHGTPFYAGWGLTRDLGVVPARRGRLLSLDELVAGVLILYPRYLDPVTNLPCPPEVLVRRMAADAVHPKFGRGLGGGLGGGLDWRLTAIAPVRRWQGRLMAMLR